MIKAEWTNKDTLDLQPTCNQFATDCISRQAAIDAILHNQEVYSNNFGDDPIDKYTTAIISNDVQTIVQLPSTQQWIPCSERLPKNDDWKIITILDESGDTPSRYTDFGWYLEVANCWIVESEQRTDVIAWVPLPKPYKGVTE